MQIEEKYMARCLQLAKGGLGNVRSNPLVGAVIVHNGQIIGEGFHRAYGEAHAEVNAIASVKDPSLLKDSTLYVNLEPCSHHGKTPPCADLIIAKGIPRVVVSNPDPFPEVSGRGVRRLREAGIEVATGIMEKEGEELNRVFMFSHRNGRPYVILKWAQSADGFIDKKRENSTIPPVLFSDAIRKQEVHKLRSEVGAILVGTHTALLDNPSLTVRDWEGISPLRITLDRRGTLPEDLSLLDGRASTWILSEQLLPGKPGVEYIPVDFTKPFLPAFLSLLYARNITSLLVEGGSYLLQQFLDRNLWEEIEVEISPLILEDGVAAPIWNASCYPIYEDAIFPRFRNGECKSAAAHFIRKYRRREFG